jgi:ferredoxin-NADP reductase
MWIAGGIGVTPSLSWIRSIGERFDRQVEFFYEFTHADDAVYLDEIRAVANRLATSPPFRRGRPSVEAGAISRCHAARFRARAATVRPAACHSALTCSRTSSMARAGRD